MAQWVELLAVKPKSLSSTFWTHRVLKKVIVFIYVKKIRGWKRKKATHIESPKCGACWGRILIWASQLLTGPPHKVEFAPFWSDGFLDRQLYLTQPPRFTELSFIFVTWGWWYTFLSYSRWILSFIQTPLQTLSGKDLIYIYSSFEPEQYCSIYGISVEITRMAEEVPQGQVQARTKGLSLQQGKTAVSSDPREEPEWNVWVLLLLVPSLVQEGDDEWN